MTRPVCPGQWPSRPLRERAVARATVASAAQAVHAPSPSPFVGLAAAAWLSLLTVSMSICPQRPAFVSKLGSLIEVLSVQWVLGASAEVTGWGRPGAALLPASWGTPPLPQTPPPGCALGSQAGGWHLTGAGLSRGGQCLRPVSARPEALPGFGQGDGSGGASRPALLPPVSVKWEQQQCASKGCRGGDDGSKT